MHEFNVCQDIVDAILIEMKKVNPPATRLVKTGVAIGRLRQLVPDYLQFAYESLTKDTPAEGSRLEIRHIPARARCEQCQWEGEVDGSYFSCPQCNSNRMEITGGRELFVENLEIEQDD